VDLSGPRAQPVFREAFEGSSKDFVPLDELERTYLERVLDGTGGLIEGSGGAAEILKLKASTLRSRLKKLGVPYGNRRRITTPSQRDI
jgi:transcriptional regulator with GAF, ATPase, and Fis domain